MLPLVLSSSFLYFHFEPRSCTTSSPRAWHQDLFAANALDLWKFMDEMKPLTSHFTPLKHHITTWASSCALCRFRLDNIVGYHKAALKLPSKSGPCGMVTYASSLMLNLPYPFASRASLATWDGCSSDLDLMQSHDPFLVLREHQILWETSSKILPSEVTISMSWSLFQNGFHGLDCSFSCSGYWMLWFDWNACFVIPFLNHTFVCSLIGIFVLYQCCLVILQMNPGSIHNAIKEVLDYSLIFLHFG